MRALIYHGCEANTGGVRKGSVSLARLAHRGGEGAAVPHSWHAWFGTSSEPCMAKGRLDSWPDFKSYFRTSSAIGSYRSAVQF